MDFERGACATQTDQLRAQPLFIVHNPKAGFAARRHFHAALARLGQTDAHGEGKRAAANAALGGLFDAIVAAGGDGTIRDVAESMHGDAAIDRHADRAVARMSVAPLSEQVRRHHSQAAAPTP